MMEAALARLTEFLNGRDPRHGRRAERDALLRRIRIHHTKHTHLKEIRTDAGKLITISATDPIMCKAAAYSTRKERQQIARMARKEHIRLLKARA